MSGRQASWIQGGTTRDLSAGLLWLWFSGHVCQPVCKYGSVPRGARTEHRHLSHGSEASAMIFGEYFPNPGAKPLAKATRKMVPHSTACFAEALGAALLALAIFGFMSRKNEGAPGPLVPIALGITLITLICIFAPLTQAGFNPARDLAPRFFSFLVGWKEIPFTMNGVGWLTVYVVSPCVGAVLGGFIGSRIRYS